MTKEKRLLTLDAMRGLAAIVIVTVHLPDVGLPPSGYLAVDFFFVLSGFVIANAYDAQVSAGMTVSRFMAHRLIRLYPVYFVGFLLGLVRAVGQSVLNLPAQLTHAHLAMSTLLEGLLLPSPSDNYLFSLNPPAWSLFFDGAASLVYIAFLAKARPGAVRSVLVVTGVALAATIVASGAVDMGSSWQTIHGGLARVSFSFVMGVFLARHRAMSTRASPIAPALALMLVALMCLPFNGLARTAYDELFVFAASPLLVYFGAKFSPAESLKPLSLWLGEISYPLYATHFPLLYMFGFAARKAGVRPVVWMPAFVILAVAVAAAIAKFWDAPVRRRLLKTIVRNDQQQIAASAAARPAPF